ncbi:hypothetical protein EOPP23_12260 [Endozoicomonas sp. OPT23]|uniref:copper chaperone PCu(A)C n=1 Tax=Endozoicomonas sp. OPT23 TaxID=2072845 RepID=UPI00129A2821|nr:copper chaperone PCu(A)C [Endozoicomonas sp. OPT23]MRI33761.1 hypothetical protein [Endozoicomonas sp. OPT23]
MQLIKKLALATAMVAGFSATTQAANVEISKPMARAVPAVSTNSAAFLTIDNKENKNITLIAAESDVAARVELHGHKMEGEMMRMFKVEGGIPVPANGQVKLQSGGYHVMMMGLKRSMKAGDQVDITLRFSDGDTATVKVPVMDMRNQKKDMAHSAMKH